MKIGEKLSPIQLPAIDGSQFDSVSLKGQKHLITFFRFATCPFCNMRIAQLVKMKADFGDDFEVVAIFESKLEHLQKHASKHLAEFPILADVDRKYYDAFGVKKSFYGMLKGMLFRIPTLLRGMFKGYIPREISSRMLIMPLSLLVDENGIIQEVYYGADEGDHIPMERIMKFAKQKLNDFE